MGISPYSYHLLKHASFHSWTARGVAARQGVSAAFTLPAPMTKHLHTISRALAGTMQTHRLARLPYHRLPY